MHIQLRLWTTTPNSSEIPDEGEPFWDPLVRRLGVWSGDNDGEVCWYPIISPTAMRLNAGQVLSGVDNDGEDNPIVISFATPDQMRFINSRTGTILATISEAGEVLHSASSMVTGTPGFLNKIINASLSVVRSLIPAGTYNTIDPSFVSPSMMAPNCYAWQTPSSAGNLAFSLSTEVPSNVGAHRSVKIDASQAPNSAGVRWFILDYPSFVGHTISASIYTKGTEGFESRLRVVTENGGEVGAIVITGTGSWLRSSVTCALPNDGSTWIAVDLHNPGRNDPGDNTWYVTAPQFYDNNVVPPFENRPSDLEASLVASLYSERYFMYEGSAGLPKHIVPLGLRPSSLTPRTILLADDSSSFSVVEAKSSHVEVSRTPAAGTTGLKVIAHYAPFSTETR